MTREIFLLRHGQTVWNRAGIIQGRKDSPLTLKGARQAEAMGVRLAEQLAGRGEYTVFASPLGRTRQSAAIVCDVIGYPDDQITFDDRLMETSFGRWENRSHSDVETNDSETSSQRNADRWNIRAPGGENYSDVGGRVLSFVGDLPSEGTIVVVAHGGMGRIWRGMHMGVAKTEIHTLPEPQDGFFRLAEGVCEYIES